MCKIEKAKSRLKSRPKDYSFNEACSLLEGLGFVEFTKGKTSGSRMKFVRYTDGACVMIHKPHPTNILKTYVVTQLYNFLVQRGEI